jgi:hypothetical protein
MSRLVSSFEEDTTDPRNDGARYGWKKKPVGGVDEVVFEIEVELPSTAFPEAPVRARDLGYIMNCVRQGQCCSVVGPSNTGKSLLLKSLPKEEVRQSCARRETRPPVIVFVDCLETGDSEQAFYELLLRRIVEELEDSTVSASTIGTLRALHHEVLHTTAAVTVRSLFASGMRELDRGREIGLVVILDEFDDVFCTLPPWPFRQLRALRDALGPRLSYITGTSRRLERLRSDADTYEFRELFHLNALVLRPLSQEDARCFVAYLASKQGPLRHEEYASLVVGLSGGHPGLLERTYSILGDIEPDPAASYQGVVTQLRRKRPIRQECRRLWDELEEEEQEGLLALAGGGEAALDADKRRALETKGLIVVSEGAGLVVFSPIFEAFLQSELVYRRRAGTKGVHCDFKTGQIWVDDREVTLELSEAQRKLVRSLYQKAGAVCTYDEIAEEVWGVGEGVSPGAIYELVKRVRQKVEPDWRDPCYIVTVPGGGYRLQVPE